MEKITSLPSQAVNGNSYGVLTSQDWRRIRREHKRQEQRRIQWELDMRDAFGPWWPNLPPGAAEDPSLI
jgi:hypothetical protein